MPAEAAAAVAVVGPMMPLALASPQSPLLLLQEACYNTESCTSAPPSPPRASVMSLPSIGQSAGETKVPFISGARLGDPWPLFAGQHYNTLGVLLRVTRRRRRRRRGGANKEARRRQQRGPKSSTLADTNARMHIGTKHFGSLVRIWLLTSIQQRRRQQQRQQQRRRQQQPGGQVRRGIINRAAS